MVQLKMEKQTTGNVKLTPMEFTDVRGKKLLYLKMEANGKELVINIGKATYEGALDVIQPRETSTTINVANPQKEAVDKYVKDHPEVKRVQV